MRFEMVEFVARVATSWAERGMAESPVAGVVILMEELFLQNLPSVVRVRCGRGLGVIGIGRPEFF